MSDRNIHPATNHTQCEIMARRNGWQLIGVEPTGVPILTVDCIFAGPQTHFPKSNFEVDDDDDDDA
ncbi:MAG: hypothetical protein Fur0042_23570 [Cyanophyceae cyanobacterium]